MDSFLQFLGLDAASSLLVINPAWSVDEPVYGYRMGFSMQEVRSPCTVPDGVQHQEDTCPGYCGHSLAVDGEALP